MFWKKMTKKIKDIFSVIEKKWKTQIFIAWEQPEVFTPPFWFTVVELIAFKNKNYVDYTRKQKIEFLASFEDNELTKLQTFVRDRVFEDDYTIPFHKPFYNFFYDTNKRLKNEFLILFYTNLRNILECEGHELKAIEKLSESKIMTPLLKKVLMNWRKEIGLGNKTFAECLKENCNMFGVYEASLYYEISGSGLNIKILERIIQHLEDLIDLDKAKKSIRVSLIGNTLLLSGCFYYTLGVVLLQIIDALDAQDSMPSDIKTMYNIGKFLGTPLGIITGVVILLGIGILFNRIKNNPVICGLMLSVPGIGNFIRFIELYIFVDSLLMFSAYLEGTDDKRLRRAIKVVDNSFIRDFFNYKIDRVMEKSLPIVDFFADNKVFGFYSEYMTIPGTFLDKLERLNVILKKNKKEVMAQLPSILETLLIVMIVSVTVVLMIIITRVELWSASPERFTL